MSRSSSVFPLQLSDHLRLPLPTNTTSQFPWDEIILTPTHQLIEDGSTKVPQWIVTCAIELSMLGCDQYPSWVHIHQANVNRQPDHPWLYPTPTIVTTEFAISVMTADSTSKKQGQTGVTQDNTRSQVAVPEVISQEQWPEQYNKELPTPGWVNKGKAKEVDPKAPPMPVTGDAKGKGKIAEKIKEEEEPSRGRSSAAATRAFCSQAKDPAPKTEVNEPKLKATQLKMPASPHHNSSMSGASGEQPSAAKHPHCDSKASSPATVTTMKSYLVESSMKGPKAYENVKKTLKIPKINTGPHIIPAHLPAAGPSSSSNINAPMTLARSATSEVQHLAKEFAQLHHDNMVLEQCI
ncbi:hypothetical protein L210DRAFT_3507616 [Boletus edulis BED1]|uniref:Uncharacterized protein n=1 Tax=Boletus edulis BED1 TaxID=1328754 RepID=A0AAD4GAH2_BOLED|nr:hypothetical protein L210DRAFT_3507616 [Boletus edulis BED1]